MLRYLVLLVVLSALTGAERNYPNRIVGGQEADIKDFPHQLALERYYNFKCGASIISKNWALTAAHCIYDAPNADYILRAGTSLRSEGGDEHQLEKIIMHSKYDSKTDDYDVALIKVKKPFDVNSGKPIKVIAIADLNTDPIKGQVTVSGWGADDENIGAPTKRLKKVTVPIVERSSCKSMYSPKNMLITDRMLCAGLPNNDSCQGDSGGPLIMGNIQVGVVSWGYGCGAPGFPGVYALIGHPEVRNWIKDTAGV